uniref:Uncharacterized protein n=1 Tax=Rhizophora mucronata TaxID=61149 RepID=A0A2P2QKR2_RHIMU
MIKTHTHTPIPVLESRDP